MESNHQPRRHDRVSATVEGQFNLLIPEVTFQPLSFPCLIRDLSERGSMQEVNMDSETYRMLLQKTQYCRLNIPAGYGLPERVVGRSVWIQPEGSAEKMSFKIGLFFEDCPVAIMEQLRSFVQRSKTSADPVS